MPSKPDIWMPLYIGDYLAATAHLDAQESGAYLHLLMHSWKNGTLPADPDALRRIARMPQDAWSIAWPVLKHFFDFSEDGTPSQGRLEKIRSDWGGKKEKAKEKATKAAEARWRHDAPSMLGDALSNAQAMLETCPSPISSPIPTTKTKAKSPAIAAFVLPGWIDRVAWGNFIDMRKKIRAPMTEHAMEIAVAELIKLEAAGNRHEEVLDQSTMKSWRGLFALKSDYGGNTHGKPTAEDASIAARQALLDRRRAGRMDSDPIGSGRVTEAGSSGSERLSLGTANGALFPIPR